MKEMTEDMLHNQNLIAPVATNVKKEAKKSKDLESQRKGRRGKFVDTAYSTGARSAPSTDRALVVISDDCTTKKAQSEMPDEKAPIYSYGMI